MRRCDRLFVLWSSPADRKRHVIGELWRGADGFAFGYRDDLKAAEESGFQLLPEFPLSRPIREPYRAGYLFSSFAQRIPSPKRPDFSRLVASWGVEDADDSFEILARSGGVQATDRIELAEYRADDDELLCPLEFRVAGTRYYDGSERLKLGDAVLLRHERTNYHDPCATIVLTTDSATLGYVPRQYSAMIARLLDANRPVTASVVRHLTLPADAGRWVVTASLIPRS